MATTVRETRVGVRELKTRLSEYLRRVKAGGAVVITEHGRPVARIIPDKGTAVERFDRLVEAGVLFGSGRGFDTGEPLPTLDGGSVADLVSEGRD